MNVPPISRPILWFFRGIVRGYFRRHFSAVRLSRESDLSAFGENRLDDRLIVYGNHSSWWDPMVLILLGQRMMPKRRHYAPMDADALERYAIFKHLGVFGVEMKTARGAAQFLRTGSAILNGGGVLWVTPQGRFADVRERPLNFKPGLALLAAKLEGGCTVVPLAIEYVFWNERLPETLLRLGEPVRLHGITSAEAQHAIEAALLQTMEALKAEAIARDPAAFSLLQHGTVGTGGFYEPIQRVWAWLRRRPFQAAHSVLPANHEGRG